MLKEELEPQKRKDIEKKEQNQLLIYQSIQSIYSVHQEKVTILLQSGKIIEKPIDKRYNRVREEREVSTMKEYKFLVRVYFK